MKNKLIPLILALGLAGGQLQAQEGGAVAGSPPAPPAAPSFKAHILPPGAVERLELTPDQYQQVVALEAEVNARLQKILTAQQLQQLQRRPLMHHGGPGGPGGQGGQGGPGGPRGQGEGDRPPPPSQ